LSQNVREFLRVLKTTRDGIRKQNLYVENIFAEMAATFSYLRQRKSRNTPNREVELNYISLQTLKK